MTSNERKKVYHQLRGARCLDDGVAESVAYLLSNEKTAGDVFTVHPDLTPEALDAIKGEELFQRRLAYLKDTTNKKRRKPKSYDEYERYALRKLHSLAEKAVDEKNQVTAAEKLGALAHKLKQVAPHEQTDSMPSGNLSDLEDAFNGGVK